jgi:hypothetical protein
LDFADSHIGNYEKDFEYLLDDEDPEEFGKKFGEKVLEYYLQMKEFHPFQKILNGKQLMTELAMVFL